MSADVLAGLVAASRLATPDDLARLITQYGRALGASDVTMYLVDYEQRVLVPIPGDDGVDAPVLAIEGTLAGRAFRHVQVQRHTGENGAERVWVPSLDGTDRVGVLEAVFESGAVSRTDEELLPFAFLCAELILAKDAYGDLFHRLRRQRDPSIAAELTMQLLPPLTFGTDRVVIAAGVFPPYDIGGDSFDYGVGDADACLAIFDAMGHELRSGLLSTVAMATFRNCRRRGLELLATAHEIDDVVASTFGDQMFVTGVIAALDLTTGCLRYVVAGHPRPLVLRHGRVVKTLEGRPGMPFGLRREPRMVSEETLEPGDQIVLYTDGVVDARSAEGTFFGVEQLVDFIATASSAGAPPPETVRMLLHAILDHHGGVLDDDATVMLVEWRGDGAALMTPTHR
jgi:hypothetical protein